MASSELRQCSLWAHAADQAGSGASKTSSETHIYFVGARGSGKTTLVNRVLYPSKVGGCVKAEAQGALRVCVSLKSSTSYPLMCA